MNRHSILQLMIITLLSAACAAGVPEPAINAEDVVEKLVLQTLVAFRLQPVPTSSSRSWEQGTLEGPSVEVTQQVEYINHLIQMQTGAEEIFRNRIISGIYGGTVSILGSGVKHLLLLIGLIILVLQSANSIFSSDYRSQIIPTWDLWAAWMVPGDRFRRMLMGCMQHRSRPCCGNIMV